MELSEKIRIIRKARGYSQEGLGENLSRVSKYGISRQSVSDWENGRTEPRLDNIRDLANVLNVSFDALLDESIDLSDQKVLDSVLTHIDPEIKQTVNSKFRYSLSVSTLSVRSFRIVIFDSVILLLTILLGCLAVFLNWDGVELFIFAIGGGILLGTLPLAVLQLIRIFKGKECVSIGELNNTHLLLYTYKDAINTLYIPVKQIERIELGQNQKKHYGDIEITIAGRNRPITVYKLMYPQKLIGIFKCISEESSSDALSFI